MLLLYMVYLVIQGRLIGFAVVDDLSTEIPKELRGRQIEIRKLR